MLKFAWIGTPSRAKICFRKFLLNRKFIRHVLYHALRIDRETYSGKRSNACEDFQLATGRNHLTEKMKIRDQMCPGQKLTSDCHIIFFFSVLFPFSSSSIPGRTICEPYFKSFGMQISFRYIIMNIVYITTNTTVIVSFLQR